MEIIQLRSAVNTMVHKVWPTGDLRLGPQSTGEMPVISWHVISFLFN